MNNIRILGKKVLVELDAPERVTELGIVIPDASVTGQRKYGTIRGVGAQVEQPIKKGDRVALNPFGGTDYGADGKNYRIVHAPDILATI